MNAAFASLSRDFGGDIIEPGDAEYDSARRSLFASGMPRYVLRPRNVEDVRIAVRTAARSDLVLSVRGGGHGFPGFGTNDGGVVIDLGQLGDVEIVDNDQHLVRVGGGATWGRVAAALAPHGLAISSGDSKSVGVGGLTLTGGIGWKVRKYGLALDNLVAAEVALADGTVVRASATENPELFWALRGGGGNFGIVTSFEFAAHPTTDVFYGTIAFPASEAAGVLQGWADYLRDAHDELTSVVDLANPPAGGPQAPLEVSVVYDGNDPELAADAIDPIRRLGTVIDDDVALTPYADTLADGASPPPGIHIVARSAFVEKEWVPEVLQTVAEVAGSTASPVIGLRSVSGAVSRVPNHATAYAHRQAELVLMTLTAGPKPVVEAAAPALDAVWARLAPHVNGAYANFLSSATEADVAAAYPPETFRRLTAVKRRYDPGNLFDRNHNVRPSLSRLDRARRAGSVSSSAATGTAQTPDRAAS
jgi:FAD/FMN-containing dehydrogenase